jgi:hypothetical protein
MTSYSLWAEGLKVLLRQGLLAFWILRRWLAWAFVVSFCFTACTPSFNWREVAINPPGMSVLMPEKPAELSRKLQLGEYSINMHMTGARVDERMFTVAVGQIDPATGLRSAQALDRMEQAMLRNIQGKVLRRESGFLSHDVAITRLKAQGESQGRPILMWAWFFECKGHVVQAVALGQAADEEQAMTFLQSLSLTP